MSFDTQQKLDALYQHIQAVILSRQHPVTGLFPASTSINNHGNYTDAWVRDNVYSIQAVWALHLAYKRASNPDKRTHELEFSCIKMMRGLLYAMMRQSHKVEAFKHSLDPKDALHAKYDTKTGLEAVADDAWGHLQIDATSFYLLMMAQMTKAGSKLIFTREESNFIQNLIYYISRTYRTPDYGIWERGNKVNNGKAEINASSVGMAKAAMEAMDGLNLFGEDGPEWSVVHSFADAVARAGSVLQSLLPKESRSKEVDSAVLSIISFPAFAVNDEQLTKRTRKEIISKLGGEYGCKRFLLDGHQSELEDQSRIYYEFDELINFEHIESEWPLFFTYLYIDRLFARDWESANFYRHKLESLMVEKDGQMLLPELYYVPQENILAEKENPGSQKRLPNDNLPLVWAQSLYLVGKMLDDELIKTDDLDPLGLHKIQHKPNKPTTSMVILAQNDAVKQKLLDAGCLCQTLEDIAPLKAISAQQLVNTYRHLGASDVLGLTGRPNRALNSLATSQAFNINDESYLCLSWIQNEDKDYRKIDPALFQAHIRNELSIIAEHWYYQTNAVFTILIDEAISDMQGCDELFEFIRLLQKRELEEFRVVPQSAKNAFKSGNRRTITITTQDNAVLGIQLPVHEKPWPVTNKSQEHNSAAISQADTDTLLARLNEKPSLAEMVECLIELGSRRALMNTVPNSTPATTAYKVLNSVYLQTLLTEDWRSARMLFSLMLQPSTDLATYIADITVRQRLLVIGETPETETNISLPLHQDEILTLLKNGSSSPIGLVICHELISIAGTLIKVHPDAFDGVRTIRIHNLALLCARHFDPEESESVFDTLSKISPSELYETLKQVLQQKHEEFAYVTTHVRYHHNVDSNDSKMKDVDWFDWRSEQGMITKLPESMLLQLWESLSHVNTIVFGDLQSNTTLDCKRALSSMTPGEDTFAAIIESLTSDIHPNWYKSLIFEGLYAFIQFCQQHKACKFEQEVNLPVLVSQAALDHVKQHQADHPEEELAEAALDEFAQITPNKVNQYLRWAVSKLHSHQHQQTSS
ncbi:glycoside hydrolase family 15 protein [Marinomonas transparens]|uniref:Glycoside hydrolase family 15 protein n=1 Tax=Marinomonas transparens TaxID=2795388 RepID=A0A934N242_9GAMM|nr:glycoside hydrolase family 15 protein [Marinomonas transparens]MBJ7537398.1 glycoside hydrolase family 15 protein [Marinomonas transparens]